MSDARIVVDPPLPQWRSAPRAVADRDAILPLLIQPTPPAPDMAARAGGPDVIATGHQPWLWHPGILAKDFAVQAYAQRVGGQAVHLVVDHDPLPHLQIDVPWRKGPALQVQALALYDGPVGVPPASLPPLNAADVAAAIERASQAIDGEVAVDVDPLIAAWANAPATDTLAAQLAAVLATLRSPLMPAPALLFSSAMHQLPTFAEMVEALRTEPARIAALYNDAVDAHPESRVAPLQVGRRRIELPLWALHWKQPRQRVYVDPQDRTLSTEKGAPLNLGNDTVSLAPRAIAMMALLRSAGCSLFVHGTGGGNYDLVTDQWWQAWRGTSLAPRVVVSADLRLAFDVPVADPADLAAARWRAHHLPHNLDRVLTLEGTEVDRKRALLASMGDDRNRTRRAAAFAEIHRINATWAQRHAAVVEASEKEVKHARIGVANRAVAHRRDWCFAFHDARQLTSLRQQFEHGGAAKFDPSDTVEPREVGGADL